MESRAGAPPRADDRENGMAFSTASGSQMADMNVTPLVDVMLVLLIIFMVTVPAISYPNSIDLTRPPPTPVPPPPALRVHIGAGDTLSIDGQALTMEQLQARFAVEAAKGISGGKLDPMRQPALELAIEPDAEYGLVARVMSRARNANLARIGFAN
jgi:biopolymer transport protein ExbD